MTYEKKELKKIIQTNLIKTIKRATTNAPKDLIEGICDIKSQETSKLAISQLELILKNFEYGAKGYPICQDTGVLNFYVNLGNRFPIISNYQKIIHRAVEKASKEVPLRGNSVDPITNENPENNLGINVPPIHLQIVNESSDLEIIVLPKGGGGENLSKLFMLNPSNGLDVFQDKIVRIIKEGGGMPCPPVILGVGLGGDASNSMLLAKKSLLRPLNQRNSRTDVAKIELELIDKINRLNVGVMGLGGKFTCLDVHIEIAMRHPASFPVGMIVQCYCHRIASFKINQKGMILNEV